MLVILNINVIEAVAEAYYRNKIKSFVVIVLFTTKVDYVTLGLLFLNSSHSADLNLYESSTANRL